MRSGTEEARKAANKGGAIKPAPTEDDCSLILQANSRKREQITGFRIIPLRSGSLIEHFSRNSSFSDTSSLPRAVSLAFPNLRETSFKQRSDRGSKESPQHANRSQSAANLPTGTWRTSRTFQILNFCVYNKDAPPPPIPPWKYKSLLGTQI